jgi:hypothetical protein
MTIAELALAVETVSERYARKYDVQRDMDW